MGNSCSKIEDSKPADEEPTKPKATAVSLSSNNLVLQGSINIQETEENNLVLKPNSAFIKNSCQAKFPSLKNSAFKYDYEEDEFYSDEEDISSVKIDQKIDREDTRICEPESIPVNDISLLQKQNIKEIRKLGRKFIDETFKLPLIDNACAKRTEVTYISFSLELQLSF